jgi:thymidylate kinase
MSLIVFEGGDRVGKSTQVHLLLKSMISAGIPAQEFKFPGKGYIIRSNDTDWDNYQ